VLLTGFLVGGWGLAGVVASGSTGTQAQSYRVTVTKTIKVRGKDGKVRTRVIRTVRIVKHPVIHDVTNSETVTTKGGTQIVTTRTTKIVPVIRVRNRVVTINGQVVTLSQTVTDMQTQTQAVTQTIDNTSTQFVDQVVTVTRTETQTQTQTLPADTVTTTEVTTVVVTETTPAVTETVTVPGTTT
jgi:hypothetical protein